MSSSIVSVYYPVKLMIQREKLIRGIYLIELTACNMFLNSFNGSAAMYGAACIVILSFLRLSPFFLHKCFILCQVVFADKDFTKDYMSYIYKKTKNYSSKRERQGHTEL